MDINKYPFGIFLKFNLFIGKNKASVTIRTSLSPYGYDTNLTIEACSDINRNFHENFMTTGKK